MRWGIPYPLAGVHVSHQLVQFTEAHASEGVVRWRELYQYRAAPRVVLLTPWLDPADWCRALSRSVAAEASVCECLRECIDGGRGGATESGQIAVQEQRFLPRSPCATEQQLATRRPAAANYEAVNGSSERRAEIRAGWGIAERGKNSRWMDGVVCVCGMGKSVSLLDGKIFLIPASNRQERCWCRDSRSSRIGASASSSSSSSRRTLPFDIRVRVGCLDSGECCLRFEKGGQRRGHSPCGPKTLRIHPTPTCPHACAMQAGSRCIVARWAGGLEWRGIMLRCRALAGAVSRACDRRCIPYGVGSVATEQGRHRCQPPTKNRQQDTRRKRFQPLLFFFFHGTHAPSPLPKSRRQPVPGETRSEDGLWARPPVPTAPLPSLRCPAAGSHLSRNASRVGRDCATPMRIDPQGPHSSTATPLSTRSTVYPDPTRACCLLLLQQHHGPIGVATWAGQAPIPSPACRTAKFALFMRQPARWRGWYGTRRPSPSGQFVAPVSERGREGRPSTLDRVPVIGPRPHSVPRSHGDGALLRAAPEAGTRGASVLRSHRCCRPPCPGRDSEAAS